jgi:hypothetical protein
MSRSIKTAVFILGLLSMICIIARGLTRLAEDAHSLFLLDVPRVWVDEGIEKGVDCLSQNVVMKRALVDTTERNLRPESQRLCCDDSF